MSRPAHDAHLDRGGRAVVALSIRLDRLDLDDCLSLAHVVDAHGVNPLAWLYGLAFVDDLIVLREREPLVELIALVVLEANRQHPRA